MKRADAVVFAIVTAGVLFAGLSHGALTVADVAEASTATVNGLTPRRLWATLVAALALVGAISGGSALRLSGAGAGKARAIVALAAGSIALVNTGLNLATATGGLGTGNGLLGSAAALVLGSISVVLGGLALARSRRGLVV